MASLAAEILTSINAPVLTCQCGIHCCICAEGPKDLPRVARFAGQATGRAAAYLTLARSKFTKFSEEAQLDKVSLVITMLYSFVGTITYAHVVR